MQKTSFITYFRTFFRVLEFYIFDYFEKQSILKNFSQTKIHKLISEGVVLDGPFKGMKYPKNESFGSAFLPKILGTYEKEISSLVQSLLNSNYDIVLDVGCAEGYYAVGFAKFGKARKVFAYDIQEKARKLCSEMAQKGLEYQSEFLLDLDFKTKYYVLAEGRPEQMKWYFVRE